MSVLRLGVLAYGVAAPVNFLAFAEKLDALVAEGAGCGGQLLVMPEYACMELAGAFPGAGDVARELGSVCGQRAALLDLFAGLARRHRVWLLPGTMPWDEGGQVRNRAPLVAPDGTMRFQDKARMTRFESSNGASRPVRRIRYSRHPGAASGSPSATMLNSRPWCALR